LFFRESRITNDQTNFEGLRDQGRKRRLQMTVKPSARPQSLL
jgi:hypothetical protein